MAGELRDTLVDGRTLDDEVASTAAMNLVVVHRDGLSVVPLVDGAPVVIGREEPSTVRPRSQRLSRQHARFVLRHGVVSVEDLGSTNGTWLRGKRLDGRTVLRVGDEVRLGSVSVTLRRDPSPTLDPSAPPSVVVDPVMQRLYETVDRVADSQLTVLILGETGVGKELVARALHDRSARAHGPMRAINCGALPANLVESTLFGHERGAFTGADQRRAGVFEEAAGGTVLLDEVGELPAAAQAALLRVLETRRVQRVGSSAEVAVDVRLVAATHRDLEAACDQGLFRRDLLYRLNAVTLRVPPLRDRPTELESLIEAFIAAANATHGRAVLGVAADALARLRQHRWPGNVRELRNVVERAVVVAGGPWIGRDDLPESIVGVAVAPEPAADDARADPSDGLEATPAFAGRRGELAPSPLDLKQRVGQFEEGLILGALAAEGGNQSAAARRLQMPRRTLVYRLRHIAEDRAPIPLDDVPFAERVEAFERQLVEEALGRAGGDLGRAALWLGVQRRTLAARLARWRWRG